MGFDYRIYTGLGKQTLGGLKQNSVLTRTQDKRAVATHETEPYLPVSVQESPAEARCESTLACRRSGALNSIVLGALGHAGISHFEGGHITAIIPPWFGLGPNSTGITGPHPSTEDWIKDLLSMAPPIRPRPGFLRINAKK